MFLIQKEVCLCTVTLLFSAGLFKAWLSQPRISRILISFFVTFRWWFQFVLFVLQFWVWIISNYTKHIKQWKTFLCGKNLILRLTFNPGLALTGFRTTQQFFFLKIKPTNCVKFQCLKNIPVPSTPYVVGLLIKRLETPWAQLFPLRLQLRLGAEFRCRF